MGYGFLTSEGPASWAAQGGLSEAITDSFFSSVLGCNKCSQAADTLIDLPVTRVLGVE